MRTLDPRLPESPPPRSSFSSWMRRVGAVKAAHCAGARLTISLPLSSRSRSSAFMPSGIVALFRLHPFFFPLFPPRSQKSNRCGRLLLLCFSLSGEWSRWGVREAVFPFFSLRSQCKRAGTEMTFSRRVRWPSPVSFSLFFSFPSSLW